MDAAAKHTIQSEALVRADGSVPKRFVAHVADTVVLRPKALVTPFWRRVRLAHRGQSERCGSLSGARDVRSAPSATGGSLCGLCGFRCSHRWKGHCGCCRCHRCDCRCTTNHPDRGGRLPDRASLGTRGSWGLTAALLRLTTKALSQRASSHAPPGVGSFAIAHAPDEPSTESARYTDSPQRYRLAQNA